jgi:hypothetical protein
MDRLQLMVARRKPARPIVSEVPPPTASVKDAPLI